jgi:hypothetical protein
MSEYHRARHRIFAQVLARLDSAFLERTDCYFGGGTRLALELDEYRESQDVDFLCSDLSGYRAIRSTVSERSLGALLQKSQHAVSLMREVRADQYGIRTVLAVDGEPVKFEVVLEARIGITGSRVKSIPIPVLDHKSCFAEKWLANADRWNDTSATSRDAIDLSFMLRSWSLEEAQAGADLAIRAYGSAIARAARSAAAKLLNDVQYRKTCARTLAIDDAKTLLASIRKLAKYAAGMK